MPRINPRRRRIGATVCTWLALLFSFASLASHAQQIVDTEGVTELADGWKMHAGDDLAWAQPGFDDSGWEPVMRLLERGLSDAAIAQSLDISPRRLRA